MRKEHEELPYRELVEALQTLCRDGATGFMLIHTDSNHSARIGLADGTIQSVAFGKYHGQQAIDALKAVQWGRFSFSPVAYRSPPRPLPSTEMILTDLAAQTWFQGSRPSAGLPQPPAKPGPGPAPRAPLPPRRGPEPQPSGDVTADLFAAAEHSLQADPYADMFAPRPAPAPVDKGVAAAKGLASRLFGRSRPTPDARPPNTESDALAWTAFGAAAPGDLPEAAAGAPFGFDLPADTVGRGDVDLTQELFAQAERQGQVPGSEPDDDVIARHLFAAAIPDGVDEGDAGGPLGPNPFAPESPLPATEERAARAAAAAEEAAEDDRVFLDLLDQPGDEAETGALTDDDLDLEREIFAATAEAEAPPGGVPPAPRPDPDDIEAQLFAGTPWPPSEDLNLNEPLDMGQDEVRQRVVGADLVELVVARLSLALGPVAPMAVSELEGELRGLSQPEELELVLAALCERIDDPEQARSFRTEVMELVFG